MGIESDQLVFDYLSRVGDLAQQRALPSGARMRLVSELRNEIDRRRSKAGPDSPASVRRILTRLGTPEEVVDAANGGSGGGASGGAGDAPGPRASVPVQPAQSAREQDEERSPRSRGLRRIVPRPRPAGPAAGQPAGPAGGVPSPPHLASTEELGSSATRPDWWRVDSTPLGPGESVPGFVGGIEIPEMLKPPPEHPPGAQAAARPAAAESVEKAAAPAAAEAAAPARRRLLRLPAPGSWANPLLLFAAVLLVAGAAMGNLVPMVLGWLIAYASRRLTPAESKWAVLGLPGLVAAAGVVWLWGRTEGRWGDPVAEGGMGDAVTGTWPWVLRGAAVASALYLLWRSQRARG
ncbi:hypothetical protein [Streptomyces minutiscleroticus]|uniref:Membrane protein n=1 Tax=Streptomyces minutiscleroticus TaxID=68238 RepID=A0A918KHE7_9ACTN|nr:hypothetical protein [Streptomyces minutiscleroticus]GGX63418.1 membrane protein [Streptomyces minutiscleroticus]